MLPEQSPRTTIGIVVQDFRDFDDTHGLGFRLSEHLLNALFRRLQLDSIEFEQDRFAHIDVITETEESRWSTFWGFSPRGRRDIREALYEGRLQLELHPRRMLSSDLDWQKRVAARPATTPRLTAGYYGWLLIVGSAYKVHDTIRVSVRAALYTQTKQDTIFVDDVECGASYESAALPDDFISRLVEAIQRYPWWRIQADIREAIPAYIAAKQLDVLSTFDTEQCRDALLTELQKGTDPILRRASARVLCGTRHKKSVIPVLLACLEDQDADVALECMGTLMRLLDMHDELQEMWSMGLHLPFTTPHEDRRDQMLLRWKQEVRSRAEDFCRVCDGP